MVCGQSRQLANWPGTGAFKHLQAFCAQVSYADRVFVVPRLTETQHVERLVTFHGDDVGWKLCLHCAVHITAYWIWCMVVCCVIVELMASVSHADIIATMMS